MVAFFLGLPFFSVSVYVLHFKCNLKTLKGGEYPNLLGYTKELFQNPSIKKTVNFEYVPARQLFRVARYRYQLLLIHSGKLWV